MRFYPELTRGENLLKYLVGLFVTVLLAAGLSMATTTASSARGGAYPNSVQVRCNLAVFRRSYFGNVNNVGDPYGQPYGQFQVSVKRFDNRVQRFKRHGYGGGKTQRGWYRRLPNGFYTGKMYANPKQKKYKSCSRTVFTRIGR